MIKEFLDQTSESITRFSKAVNRIVGVWQEFFDKLGKCPVQAVNGITEFLMIYQCPNRRIAHLAKYHKKARVRKKNIHRIMKENGGMNT